MGGGIGAGEGGKVSSCVGPNAVMLSGGDGGSILCLLRVGGNGAGRVGPIHTVHRDLELRSED